MERPVHAVVLPPGRRLYAALARALDGGPAICPLSPGLPAPALEAMLAALRPAAVVTADGERPYRGRPGAPGPADPADATDAAAGEAGEAAVLIATSGSTGAPKIVELSAAALRFSAAATLRRLGARPGDRWLCCLPTSHIAGIQVLVRSLVAGTEPIIHERFDVEAVAAAVRRGAVQHIALVPAQLRRLIDAGAGLNHVETILLGGAAAAPELIDAARSAGAPVVTTYGMSETCGGCVYDGVPLDGVFADVGADGLIRLAGPVLLSGYRLRPDLTAAAVRDGWFVTSDLGSLENGVLRVLGRADDVINTGGEKVVPGMVERVLAAHPAIKDIAVVGRADPEWGQRVVAVVVPAGPAPAADDLLADLRAWVRDRLPACAAPRQLEFAEAIPLLPSGKPDRARLRAGG
ncbi:MAG TPA: AMP-binding protein [Streptosporangiaceae bacterium]|nr:AMP-binding protein [Streptosporangiaceae bacterium]